MNAAAATLASVTPLFPPPDPARELLKHTAGVVAKVTEGKLPMHPVHVAGAVLDAVDDGWLKLNGRWVRVPDDFAIEVP